MLEQSLIQSDIFTFLQALMDEATVLSVLTPSTSTDSEPSNMADDWKLLHGAQGQRELPLSKQILVKCSTPCCVESRRSARAAYPNSDGDRLMAVTFVPTVQEWHWSKELTILFSYCQLRITSNTRR